MVCNRAIEYHDISDKVLKSIGVSVLTDNTQRAISKGFKDFLPMHFYVAAAREV